MSEMAAIQGALTALKTATEVAKYLRETDLSLEKAELKNQVADLVAALADLKMQLSDAQDEEKQAQSLIKELKEALEIKGSVAKHRDAYYLTGQDGEPQGQAYCARCYENDHRLRSVIRKPKEGYVYCAVCNTSYEARRAAPLGGNPESI